MICTHDKILSVIKYYVGRGYSVDKLVGDDHRYCLVVEMYEIELISTIGHVF